MRALAVVVFFDGRPATGADVDAMCARAVELGGGTPDVVIDRSAAFASVTRVDIEPTTGIAQSADLLVGVDARIDNAGELNGNTALGRPNGTVKSPEDLILQSWRRVGEGTVPRLLGDFAIAVWDHRTQTLVCARDHFGVRPFYYYCVPGRVFVGASDPRVLLASPLVADDLDEGRIADFLAYLVTSNETTFFAQVKRLPPAHTLRVTRDGSVATRWWQLEDHDLGIDSDEEYAEAFRERFASAVECRLSRPPRIGVLLSGGLDSSSVAVMARHLVAGAYKLRTLSAVHGTTSVGEDNDDRFRKALLEGGDFDPHFVPVNDVSPLANLDLIAHRDDGPSDNPHAAIAPVMLSGCVDAGIVTLLDGVDGDAVLSYYFLYLLDLLRAGRFVNVAQEARALARHFHRGEVTARSLAWRWAMRPMLGHALRTVVGPVRSPRRLPAACAARHDFAERSGLLDRLADHRRRAASMTSSHVYHRASLQHPMVAHALESGRKHGWPLGLDQVHPFYDRRVVEFCVALPREQRVHEGWTRPIVRRALSDLLPAQVRMRGDKWVPYRNVVERLIRLDGHRFSNLRALTTVVHEWVDPVVVGRLWDTFIADPTPTRLYELWPVLSLSRWIAAREGHLEGTTIPSTV